jgi:hypothetical protein
VNPRNAQVVGLLGAVAVIIGAVLPWASIFAIDVRGTEGDGKITIGAAVVVGLCALAFPRIWAAILALLAALAIGGTGIYDTQQLSGTVASVGSGLIITDAGAVVCLLGSILAFMSKRPASRMMPPPAYATYGNPMPPAGYVPSPAQPAVTYSPDGRYWWNGQQWVPVAAPAGPPTR